MKARRGRGSGRVEVVRREANKGCARLCRAFTTQRSACAVDDGDYADSNEDARVQAEAGWEVACVGRSGNRWTPPVRKRMLACGHAERTCAGKGRVRKKSLSRRRGGRGPTSRSRSRSRWPAARQWWSSMTRHKVADCSRPPRSREYPEKPNRPTRASPRWARATQSAQHSPRNEFFGNGCPKSSTHVVRFGFVYASSYCAMYAAVG